MDHSERNCCQTWHFTGASAYWCSFILESLHEIVLWMLMIKVKVLEFEICYQTMRTKVRNFFTALWQTAKQSYQPETEASAHGMSSQHFTWEGKMESRHKLWQENSTATTFFRDTNGIIFMHYFDMEQLSIESAILKILTY